MPRRNQLGDWPRNICCCCCCCSMKFLSSSSIFVWISRFFFPPEFYWSFPPVSTLLYGHRNCLIRLIFTRLFSDELKNCCIEFQCEIMRTFGDKNGQSWAQMRIFLPCFDPRYGHRNCFVVVIFIRLVNDGVSNVYWEFEWETLNSLRERKSQSLTKYRSVGTQAHAWGMFHRPLNRRKLFQSPTFFHLRIQETIK